jgi:pantothenate kinase
MFEAVMSPNFDATYPMIKLEKIEERTIKRWNKLGKYAKKHPDINNYESNESVEFFKKRAKEQFWKMKKKFKSVREIDPN